MKFDRLRIVGFKTFVDPVEMVIEPGLTGVVGPNGCGKSNLVEALRWVMGETSHKSMRASGMDDVIFSGSGQRSSRNHAEVLLRISNAEKDAPAAFNEADALEVSRRIEREAGSTYRINGREVRARDVQLLFADAASGARSPSMVRQGQINEIIAAKPQARRRLLEDAAGIAGLHARRHDAELKLTAAEENLTRVVDVLSHIDGQVEGLKRQVRQAERYRVIAADLRRAEAIRLQISHLEAESLYGTAIGQHDLAVRAEADALVMQGEAERERAIATHVITPLRQEEAKASEHLQRLLIAREAIEGEEKRTSSRIVELEQRLMETGRDKERASQQAEDATRAIERLETEKATLLREETDRGSEASTRDQLTEKETALTKVEQQLIDTQAQLAAIVARQQAARQAVTEIQGRISRLASQKAEITRQRAVLLANQTPATNIDTLRERLASALAQGESAEKDVVAAENAVHLAREEEARLRTIALDAERRHQKLETEAQTIRKILSATPNKKGPRALDKMSVAKGYEMALGAALGDDLEAALSSEAPIYWTQTGDASLDPALPAGVEPLLLHVQVPPALQRRMAQIGVTSRQEAAHFRALLKPGQRLVTREGDLWRWDGFVAAADSPSPAARRLAELNRLSDLEETVKIASKTRESTRQQAEVAIKAALIATSSEAKARESVRQNRRQSESARDSLASAVRVQSEHAARSKALEETAARLESDSADLVQQHEQAANILASIVAPETLQQTAAELRQQVAEYRHQAADLRALLQGYVREREVRTRRSAIIAEEIARWKSHAAQSRLQIEEVTDRQRAIAQELEAAQTIPATLMARRRELSADIDVAESARKVATDRRLEGETALAVFDRAAREAMTVLGEKREARARAEERQQSALTRLEALRSEIFEVTGGEAQALGQMTGIVDAKDLPRPTETDLRIVELRRERDRIGAVNLRADAELAEIEETRCRLSNEHRELTEAIRRLRRGIESLNAEGRTRLLAAFETVNGHFTRLFSRLFGGGTAELQLIESDDPLEAGLEILAHPPGKKPQVLTLLSGGEQALTATALIFAVFLTNPSPVCVLDEVDAPLDDSNVERLCQLLTDMARDTQTRFIVITHNPISMARMDRLFGVTMAEKGVSQLVSVDLQSAERLVEAV